MSATESTRSAAAERRFRDRRGLISRAAIGRLAQQVAESFRPDRIILFGSYAYGRPHPDSDVDLLVVMPTRNEIDESIRIWNAIDPPFPLDIIVRTPKNMQWRLEEGDWFLQEIVKRGQVLYEKADRRLGAQGRSRPGDRAKNRPRKTGAT